MRGGTSFASLPQGKHHAPCSMESADASFNSNMTENWGCSQTHGCGAGEDV